MITLSEIASKAKVAKSTVSMALKDSSEISPSTRERIKKIAQELGYTENPLSKALTLYRMKGRQSAFGKIAWIESSGTADSHRRSLAKEYFYGASREAKKLGFELKKIELPKTGSTSCDLDRHLLDQEYQGVVLIPHSEYYSHLHISWDRFFSVSVGHAIARPRLHVVASDQYLATLISLRRLRALGYRRIGMVIKKSELHYFAAFSGEELSWENSDRIAPHLLSEEAVFKPWIKCSRPDVILTSETRVFEWVKNLKFRIPKEIGFAYFCHSRETISKGFSGFDQRIHLVGASAIDTLMQLFQGNQKGLPARPSLRMVQGVWIEGKTTRLVNRS
jgi:DNA-binding LacI/PurR family transcriptional regulator